MVATEIAAVVRDEADDHAYVLTLVENVKRDDLTLENWAGLRRAQH